MRKPYYADGVAYKNIKVLAEAIRMPYATVYQRFIHHDSFIINGVFVTRLDPEQHDAERAKAARLVWRPNRITTTRRMINEKPAPLLGVGHITHGINDRFGK